METVTLDQGDWNVVKKGIIQSGGLGPCIAVAVYIPTKKTAWMIHEANMDVDEPLEDFFKRATKNIKNRENLEVYAVGCSIDKVSLKEIEKKCLDGRKYAERTLYKWFTKDQVIINWGNPGDITELLIDTMTSEVIKIVNGNGITLNNNKTAKSSGYYDANGNPL